MIANTLKIIPMCFRFPTKQYKNKEAEGVFQYENIFRKEASKGLNDQFRRVFISIVNKPKDFFNITIY